MSELRKNWAHRRAALGLTLQLAVMLAAFWGGSWLLLNGAYFVYFQLDLGRYWWVFLFKEIVKHLLPVLGVLWIVVGTVLITGWVFCKQLRYLDEVTEAAGRLARPGEDPIRLRPQLKPVQGQLTHARAQGLRAAAAVRHAAGVAKIDDVLAGQYPAQLAHGGQPAQAAVKHTDWPCIHQ